MSQGLLLLVEDHADLAATLCEELESRGFAVDYAANGAAGLELAAARRFDLIILDWMLPKLPGVEVCRRLRRQRIAAPVLMLTARDQVEDRIEGLEAGADDYLVKPFHVDELVARIEALLRRARGRVVDGELRVADLVFDVGSLGVRRGQRTLSLSPTRLRILRVLMTAAPSVVSREALERELWGESRPDSDVLRTHIYNLRQALDGPGEPKLLETLPGIGYRLADGDA